MSKARLGFFAAAMAIFLAMAALYSPLAGYDFVNFDDPYLVRNNPLLLQPLGWELLLEPVAGLYHPLTNLTFWLDAQAAGLAPGRFHLSNLAFHALAVLGLMLWVMQLSRSWLAAAILGAAFAWHPTHIESVAWISERKDVVSAAFFWWCLVAHGRALATNAKRWWWAAVCLGLLSLLAKPFALGLPVLWALVEWRERGLAAVKARWPWLLLMGSLCLAAGVLAFVEQSRLRGVSESGLTASLLALPQQLLFYVHKTLWPRDLKVFYSYADLGLAWRGTLLALAYLVTSFLAARRTGEFRRDLAFGWGFFALTIFPLLKIVPFGDASVVADRYLYVSQTGLLFPWALAAARAGSLRDPRLWGAALLLLAWLGGAWQRLPDWRNSEALWLSLLRQDPGSALAHENLGRHYLGLESHERALAHLAQGKTDTLENQLNQAFLLLRMRRFDEAERKLLGAQEAQPRNQRLLNLLGTLHLERGAYERAAAYFHQSLQAPAALSAALMRAEALSNLGLLEFRRGQALACVDWQSQALAALPSYLYAYYNRALCYLQLGDLARAGLDYQRVLALQPRFALAYNGLGVVALKQGDLPGAERLFREALAVDPNLEMARNNLRALSGARTSPPKR